MQFPSAAQITAVGATLAVVIQHFSFLLPAQEMSDANRDANFEGRDRLRQCMVEREEYLGRLLGEP